MVRSHRGAATVLTRYWPQLRERGTRCDGVWWMSLLFSATAALAVQATPATVIPLNIPPHTMAIIEHSDVRILAAEGTATFRQRGELSFVSGEGAVIASYRMLDRRCDGPAAICAAFTRLGAGVDGRVFRYRIGLADQSVSLLEAVTVPLGSDEGEAASTVATLVAQSEAAAPGAILAADLRQLIRFAATPLPQLGNAIASPEGHIRLTELNATHARMTIQWEPRVTHAVSLTGSGECQVSRATGLAEQCRFVDWTGEDRTRPIRVRETRVTLLPLAVS